MKRSRFAVPLGVGIAALAGASSAWAIHVPLQSATADFSQPSFPVTALNDNVYQLANPAGAGWAIDDTQVPISRTAVVETVSDVGSDGLTTLRFNVFAGGFSTHTVGKYRISYTTDDRSTFADGATSGGDVTANWTVIKPSSALSSGGATLTIQPDGSVLASGANPELSTDTIYAKVGQLPAGITGFRFEALEDPSFPGNGPGRTANGNIVLREFDVARFDGSLVPLQNGTAQRSQGGFSVDNVINGDFDFENANNPGWANNAEGNNIATMETVSNIVGGATKDITVEIMSGGFSVHTIGKFRISATTADRSLFADGNDNGGAGVGTEPIWTVLDPLTIVSDNATTIFTEDLANIITVSGGIAEYEHYTLTFRTTLDGITGFRLETLEDPSFPGAGPGRASNGNFVIREFSVFVAVTPEPTSLALLGVGGLALLRRRRA